MATHRRELYSEENARITTVLSQLSGSDERKALEALEHLIGYVDGDASLCGPLVKQTPIVSHLVNFVILKTHRSVACVSLALRLLEFLAMETQSAKAYAPFLQGDKMKRLVEWLAFPEVRVPLCGLLIQMFTGIEGDTARSVATTLGLPATIVSLVARPPAPPPQYSVSTNVQTASQQPPVATDVASIVSLCGVIAVICNWTQKRRQDDFTIYVPPMLDVIDTHFQAAAVRRQNACSGGGIDNGVGGLGASGGGGSRPPSAGTTHDTGAFAGVVALLNAVTLWCCHHSVNSELLVAAPHRVYLMRALATVVCDVSAPNGLRGAAAVFIVTCASASPMVQDALQHVVAAASVIGGDGGGPAGSSRTMSSSSPQANTSLLSAEYADLRSFISQLPSQLNTIRREHYKAEVVSAALAAMTSSLQRAAVLHEGVVRYVLASCFGCLKTLLTPLASVDVDVTVRACSLLTFTLEHNYQPAIRLFVASGGLSILLDVLGDYNEEVLASAIALLSTTCQDPVAARGIVEKGLYGRVAYLLCNQVKTKVCMMMTVTPTLPPLTTSSSSAATADRGEDAAALSIDRSRVNGTPPPPVSLFEQSPFQRFVESVLLFFTVAPTDELFSTSLVNAKDVVDALVGILDAVTKSSELSCLNVFVARALCASFRRHHQCTSLRTTAIGVIRLISITLDTMMPYDDGRGGGCASSAAMSSSPLSLGAANHSETIIALLRLSSLAIQVCERPNTSTHQVGGGSRQNEAKAAAIYHHHQMHPHQLFAGGEIPQGPSQQQQQGVSPIQDQRSAAAQGLFPQYRSASADAMAVPAILNGASISPVPPLRRTLLECVSELLYVPTVDQRIEAWSVLTALATHSVMAQRAIVANRLILQRFWDGLLSSVDQLNQAVVFVMNLEASGASPADIERAETMAASSLCGELQKLLHLSAHILPFLFPSLMGTDDSSGGGGAASTNSNGSSSPPALCSPRVISLPSVGSDTGGDLALLSRALNVVACISSHPIATIALRMAAVDSLQRAATCGLLQDGTQEGYAVVLAHHLFVVLTVCENSDAEDATMLANRAFKLMLMTPKTTMSTVTDIVAHVVTSYQWYESLASSHTEGPPPPNAISTGHPWRWAPIDPPVDQDDCHDLLVSLLPLFNGLLHHDQRCCDFAFDCRAWMPLVDVLASRSLELGLKTLAVFSLGNLINHCASPQTALPLVLSRGALLVDAMTVFITLCAFGDRRLSSEQLRRAAAAEYPEENTQSVPPTYSTQRDREIITARTLGRLARCLPSVPSCVTWIEANFAPCIHTNLPQAEVIADAEETAYFLLERLLLLCRTIKQNCAILTSGGGLLMGFICAEALAIPSAASLLLSLIQDEDGDLAQICHYEEAFLSHVVTAESSSSLTAQPYHPPQQEVASEGGGAGIGWSSSPAALFSAWIVGIPPTAPSGMVNVLRTTLRDLATAVPNPAGSDLRMQAVSYLGKLPPPSDHHGTAGPPLLPPQVFHMGAPQ